MDEPMDLERSRLLLVWLQARRGVDRCLSDLLAAGPAGERRVRERLTDVDNLENRARQAYVNYRKAATSHETEEARDWADPTVPPRLDLVHNGDASALVKSSRTGSRGGRGHR